MNNALNTSYLIVREVYNVTVLSKVTSGSPDFDQALTNILVGGTSRLCGQSLTIRNFGFGLLTSAPLGHTCGAAARWRTSRGHRGRPAAPCRRAPRRWRR